MQSTEICRLVRIKPSLSFQVSKSVTGDIQIHPSTDVDEFYKNKKQVFKNTWTSQLIIWNIVVYSTMKCQISIVCHITGKFRPFNNSKSFKKYIIFWNSLSFSNLSIDDSTG